MCGLEQELVPDQVMILHGLPGKPAVSCLYSKISNLNSFCPRPCLKVCSDIHRKMLKVGLTTPECVVCAKNDSQE